MMVWGAGWSERLRWAGTTEIVAVWHKPVAAPQDCDLCGAAMAPGAVEHGYTARYGKLGRRLERDVRFCDACCDASDGELCRKTVLVYERAEGL